MSHMEIGQMIGGFLRRGASVVRALQPPKFVIDAPGFTHMHSGVRCMHLLCDRLNRLGISAAVTSRVIDPRAMTPQVNRSLLKCVPSMLDQSVVIYPELTAGNPLGAKHVVRYLLNKPGFFNGVGLDSYGAGDYFIHHAEEFRPSGLASRPLRLPLVDKNVFMPPARRYERKGFLVYSHRYSPEIDRFPSWVNDRIVVSWETPRDAQALAQLYCQSRGLIVGERTAAIIEALHCHCPVIFLPNPSFAYETLVKFLGGHGLVIGFDQEALCRAMETAPAFAAHYAAQFVDVDRRILEFVADAGRHFGLQTLLHCVTPRAMNTKTI